MKLADRLAGTINRQILINMVGMDRALAPKLWARVISQYHDILRMPFDVARTRKYLNYRPDINLNDQIKAVL